MFIYSKYRTQNNLCNSLTTDLHGVRNDMNFVIFFVQSTSVGIEPTTPFGDQILSLAP